MIWRSAPKSLWPLAVAGLFALATALPAAGQSEQSPPPPATKPAPKKKKSAATAPTPAAKPEAAAKPDKGKSDKNKPAAKEKTEKPAAAKPAANSTKKTKPEPPPKNATAKNVPLPAQRPAAISGHNLAPLGAAGPSPVAPNGATVTSLPPAPPRPAARPSNAAPLAVAASSALSELDVIAVKRAVELVRGRKISEATEVRKGIADPVAKKLVEWLILRSDDASAYFSRYQAFIAENPSWPSIVTLRRKAEAILYQERPDPAAVKAFFAQTKPLSAKGRLALARALVALGDRKGAEALVRGVWHADALSQEVEARTLEVYGDVLTRADHKARMDRRLYDDAEAGLRMANRLGGEEIAIAKARIAVLKKAGNAKALLDAVPAAARKDAGYLYSRAQWLRRGEHISEAAAVVLSAGNAIPPHHDLDEWWVERRVLVRKLLDAGDAKNAYLVARHATEPPRDNYRADHQFTAGWIALRYLNDPATAHAHFTRLAQGADNPTSMARGAYWLGRAAEALNKPQEARAHYAEAARYPTAYYGQIARARAGMGESGLGGASALSADQRARVAQLEIVRAVDLLYSVGARDLVGPIMADLGDKSDDAAALLGLAELAGKYDDARGMLLVGKLALGRGLALEQAAFPVIGVPNYKPIGPEVEPALVYSIVRQESWFNPRTISRANALGLMQVMPATGRALAKKFNVPFDQNRMLNDATYNVQLGAAELGDVIKDYRGSYIMAFAAYNAGRGRVREWIGKYGDPRDPKVDPIDWVERIPLSETRNYVQRVMENVQVYRARFGGGSRLLIEADLRRGSSTN